MNLTRHDLERVPHLLLGRRHALGLPPFTWGTSTLEDAKEAIFQTYSCTVSDEVAGKILSDMKGEERP